MRGLIVDATKVWGFGFCCGGFVGVVAGILLAIFDQDAREKRHRRRMERAALKRGAQ